MSSPAVQLTTRIFDIKPIQFASVGACAYPTTSALTRPLYQMCLLLSTTQQMIRSRLSAPRGGNSRHGLTDRGQGRVFFTLTQILTEM